MILHLLKRIGGNNEKRTALSALSVMNWLRRIAQNSQRGSCIKTKYYMRQAEIQSDKQITEMFQRLDTDGSNSIDMGEMHELFLENGLNMPEEEIAEMFSIVKEINDANWLS